MNNLTVKINREDCVGDSVGKHNYNIINLDTYICNLSTSFFGDNGILSSFLDISSNAATFNDFGNKFSSSSILAYNLIDNTIKNLKKYWELSEFTIQFNSKFITPNISNDISNIFTDKTLGFNLSSAAKGFLDSNYPATNYTNGSKINVVFLLYNLSNASDINQINYIATDSSTTPLIVSTPESGFLNLDDYSKSLRGWNWSPSNLINTQNVDIFDNDGFTITDPVVIPYNAGIRSIRCDFTKTSIQISNITILQYRNINNNWV